jgi:zinc transport system ATP-binding protein
MIMAEANENEPVIRTHELSLGYGSRMVLANVNAAFNAGEFWFLLGPNGEGKSTFLMSILGVLAPKAGTVKLRHDLASRERIGFVPQRCDLNPALPTTLCEFVSLGLVGIRASSAERRNRISWALENVGLQALADKNYWSLSGGQRQRTLVARALVRKPLLLIADEPTNGLDPSAEHSLMQSLLELNRRERLTVLFVTHDLSLAASYSTHVALFHDGTVQAGRSDQILTSQNMMTTYGVDISIERQPRHGATNQVMPEESPRND